MQSLAVCKFSVCCTAKWDGFLPWRKLTFATDQECAQISHLPREPALSSHSGTHCWSYCAVTHSTIRTQAEFEWGVRHLAQEYPHGWRVPSVLPVDRGRCGFTFTSQQNPELAPAPPAGWGWENTAWMPWEFHTAFGAGLYESQNKAPMLPLTLPLLCIFHCFLISSTALVFVSRGHFLHSA